MTGKKVIGGMKETTATSLMECHTKCTSTASCVGLDWDKMTTVASARCWLHTEATGGCNTPVSRMCCDHYKKTPSVCSKFGL